MEQFAKSTKEKNEARSQRKRYKRYVEWYHFRDFLLLFLGGELLISTLIMALGTARIIKNATLWLAIGFVVYLLLVGRYCVHIYFGERSPKLYFKTALAALAVEGIAAAAAAHFGGVPLTWGFAILRMVRILRWGGNLRSVAYSMVLVAIVMVAAYFVAHALEKHWYKPAEPRESEEEYRKLTPIAESEPENETVK